MAPATSPRSSAPEEPGPSSKHKTGHPSAWEQLSNVWPREYARPNVTQLPSHQPRRVITFAAGYCRCVMSINRSPSQLPTVTAIVPVRNEERTLVASLASIVAQDYEGSLDIVVAVGPSDDRSWHVGTKFANRNANVTIVHNSVGSTPAGLNVAISAARGDIIVRCDAHSELPVDYVSKAVSILQSTGAVNVGGIQRAIGETPVQRAIAAAMSSPFGVGDARFHTGGSAGFVDTVYLGVFLRSALEAVRGYDESLIRNQDYELNHRLRKVGGIYFDPALEVVYRPRSSVRALWRQYWQYGRWKRVVMTLHPGSARWRQFVAPLFVLGLLGSAIAAAAGNTQLALVVPSAWLIACAGVSFYELVRRRDWAMVALPASFAAMHIAWGIGFLLPSQRRAKES